MNILGKEPKFETSTYSVPATFREDENEVTLEKALIFSFVAHIVLALLLLLIPILLPFLGITLPQKQVEKPKDIEFVLVNQSEEKPINPTKYRADRNTRAGGKHDPSKPISPPEPVAVKSSPQRASAPSRVSRPSTPAPQRVSRPQKHTASRPAEKSPKVPPRPSPRPTFSRPNVSRPNGFNIPVPVSKAPKARTGGGGPVTSGPIGDSGSSSSPAPIMGSGSGASGSRGSASGGRYGSGYSAGGGNPGNPGPGNPNGRPGIDAVREPDFGPYMRDLQRRIKRNWEPPRGNESKRVVLLFKISRDGRLLGLSVQKSSGNSETDRAALEAVKYTAPFRPLPPEFKGNDIDIQFTFDYNVFGVGGRRY